MTRFSGALRAVDGLRQLVSREVLVACCLDVVLRMGNVIEIGECAPDLRYCSA